MSTIEFIIVLALALIGYFAPVSFFINDVIALPVIRGNGCARLDRIEDEGFHGIPGTIQGDMQTNATHSFFDVSALNGDQHNGIAFGSTAWLSGTLTADEKLIDLNAAGELFSLLTNSAVP